MTDQFQNQSNIETTRERQGRSSQASENTKTRTVSSVVRGKGKQRPSSPIPGSITASTPRLLASTHNLYGRTRAVADPPTLFQPQPKPQPTRPLVVTKKNATRQRSLSESRPASPAFFAPPEPPKTLRDGLEQAPTPSAVAITPASPAPQTPATPDWHARGRLLGPPTESDFDLREYLERRLSASTFMKTSSSGGATMCPGSDEGGVKANKDKDDVPAWRANVPVDVASRISRLSTWLLEESERDAL
jgi:hypothetical protein